MLDPEPVDVDINEEDAFETAVTRPWPVLEPEDREVEQAFLAAIVESSNDAIIGKTLEGVIQSWNAAAERIFGYRASEAIGRSILFIIPDDLRSEEVEIMAHIRRGERVEHFETVRVTKDGRRIPLSLTISPIRDGRGRIIGASKIARDISQQKAAEEALRESNRWKDLFFATLGHELRSPLSAIGMAIDVLRTDGDDPEIREGVQRTMERQTANMKRLADDLLDLARIGRGQMQLRASEVPLSEVVAMAVEATGPMVRAAGHKLIVRLPKHHVLLRADPTRMAQILSNLLSNAAKYTPERGSITLEAEVEGTVLALAVSDTGIGIPPAMLERIFEAFVRGSRSDVEARSGLGIGLTLVKSLVQLHGGAIHVHSDGPGHGARFTVRMPIVIA